MIQTLFGSLDEQQKPSFLDRMKEAVTRTRENLAERIDDVVSLGKEIDRGTLDDLEATLIGADLGTTTTHEILEKLRDKADRKQIRDVNELKRLLKDEILAILTAADSRPHSPEFRNPQNTRKHQQSRTFLAPQFDWWVTHSSGERTAKASCRRATVRMAHAIRSRMDTTTYHVTLSCDLNPM